MNLESVLEDALVRPVVEEEALFLFERTEGEHERELLFAAARAVRKAETGDAFYFTGGIASVLPCRLRPLCRYCPYWRSEDQDPLSIDDIVEAGLRMKREGILAFHLSGGTTLGSDGTDMLQIVKALYDAGVRDVDISVNCGAAMDEDTLAQLGRWGVRSVGAVFEITNPEVFKKVKPGDDLEAKKEFAWSIGRAGLKMTSGMMAGLGPRETRYEDYVRTLFDIARYPHLESMYISKFTPDPSIPMRNWETCSLEEAARLVAVARLLLRERGVTTAAGWTNSERPAGIMAGAGTSLFAFAANREVKYWNGSPQEPSRLEGSVVYRDRRPEMRRMASECDIMVRE